MGSGSESGRFESLNRFRSLPEAILAARRTHGAGRVAFEDIEGTALTYGQLTLGGAVLDWHDSLMGAHFKVVNPQAVSGCGCGTSFAVA